MSTNTDILHQELKSLGFGKNWYWFLIIGLIMLIGGIMALIKPFAASLTVDFIIGWTFIFAGIINIIQTFSSKVIDSRFWTFTLGLIAVLLGISLLTNPLAGVLSLTMVAAILIGVSGILKVVYAFNIRPYTGWVWMCISGVISILLAGLILTNFGGAALITLGIMLAIELISSGILLILVGFSLKKINQA